MKGSCVKFQAGAELGQAQSPMYKRQVDPILPHSVPTWNPTRLDLAGSNLQVGPGRAGLCTCPPSGRPAGHPPGATLVSPTS